ncbi:Ribonuclease I precursor [hydrothermal vent metagenome]|uniref:Ribonuclease I n=1 Tax=hydrothermal vent metagenome TaxID=652676 RepID=A0A1W1BB52_9ZZZZ
MRKLSILVVLFTILLQAQSFKKVAQDSCEIYNNIRHTQNSGNYRLEIGREYRVTREQNDQYYILVPGIRVPNRWVDSKCFDTTQKIYEDTKQQTLSQEPIADKKDRDKAYAKKPKSLLLALSWQHAFCETHRNRRECRYNRSKAKSNYKFVLHGLWPQPRDNFYCNIPKDIKAMDKNRRWNELPDLELSDDLRMTLSKVMPGYNSNLHKHEWYKHGTCYGTSEEEYFLDAVSLTNQVNSSKLGEFFAKNQGRTVTLQQVRYKAEQSFGRGIGKKIEMKCRDGRITELWFHLGYGGDDLSKLLRDGKNVRSRCGKGLIDRAGFI